MAARRLRIPLVGPGYQTRARDQSAQRLINWFVEATEQGGKTQFTLYPTPGLIQVAELGDGPVRGAIGIDNDRAVIVASDGVYLLHADLTHDLLGTIGTDTDPVGMAYNGDQVIIVDGQHGYIVEVADETVARITDTEFPNGVTWAQYLDRYFVVGGDGTGRFYISDIADGKGWVGTEFATAEGDPDPLVAGIVDHRELILFGTASFEIWTNTGNPTFPIERTGNAFGEVGCAATATVCKADNTVFWLGKDRGGDGVVWRMNGYQPVRISNHAVEWAIRQYERIDDALAFTYQDGGHAWYVLHFPSADRTWVYSINGGYWHEWLWFREPLGTMHRHRSNCHVMIGRKHIVGDWENGKLYELSPTTYDDAGDPIRRVRRTFAEDADLRQIFYTSLQIDLRAGVGLENDQGRRPRMMLRWSNDGGNTWSNERVATMGKIGEYFARCKFERLGAGRARVWEIAVTDPVEAVVLGAVILAEAGES